MGFGFVRHSRAIFCRAVPNPNITIRHFFIAVPHQPRRVRSFEELRARPHQKRFVRGDGEPAVGVGSLPHEEVCWQNQYTPPPPASSVRLEAFRHWNRALLLNWAARSSSAHRSFFSEGSSEIRHFVRKIRKNSPSAHLTVVSARTWRVAGYLGPGGWSERIRRVGVV
jgi:hypothetical protein